MAIHNFSCELFAACRCPKGIAFVIVPSTVGTYFLRPGDPTSAWVEVARKIEGRVLILEESKLTITVKRQGDTFRLVTGGKLLGTYTIGRGPSGTSEWFGVQCLDEWILARPEAQLPHPSLVQDDEEHPAWAHVQDGTTLEASAFKKIGEWKINLPMPKAPDVDQKSLPNFVYDLGHVE